MKRFRERGTFSFKRRKGWPRYKKRPVWVGVSLHVSKKGGVLREEHHCVKHRKCKIVVCRVIIPLNKRPPKECIREGVDGDRKA